jgi:hypothetical protein
MSEYYYLINIYYEKIGGKEEEIKENEKRIPATRLKACQQLMIIGWEND